MPVNFVDVNFMLLGTTVLSVVQNGDILYYGLVNDITDEQRTAFASLSVKDVTASGSCVGVIVESSVQ